MTYADAGCPSSFGASLAGAGSRQAQFVNRRTDGKLLFRLTNHLELARLLLLQRDGGGLHPSASRCYDPPFNEVAFSFSLLPTVMMGIDQRHGLSQCTVCYLCFIARHFIRHYLISVISQCII